MMSSMATIGGADYMPSHGASIGRKAAEYCNQFPQLRPGYARMRKLRHVIRYAANFDMTSKCNLFCEGCYYFEGDDFKNAKEQMELQRWRDFFAEQAIAGVTYGSFVGAEPALVQDRIAEAIPYISRGSIYTNGTIRIDPAIPYVLHVSVWGDASSTKLLRGGDTFWKAIKNYAGDPRARFVFTVNRHNIDELLSFAEICNDHDIPLEINYFSPTDRYQQKIAAQTGNDKEYYRLSSEDWNLSLDQVAISRIRQALDTIRTQYPAIMRQTPAFERLIVADKPMHNIDPQTGMATNCSGLNHDWHKTYRVDLKESDAKCCLPNLDCRHCRAFAPAIFSLMFNPGDLIDTPEGFRDWLEIGDQFSDYFLLASDTLRNSPHHYAGSKPHDVGAGNAVTSVENVYGNL